MDKRTQGIIKSLLSSELKINPKNVNFNIVKSILLSKELDLVINKNSDTIRSLIVYYKNEIEKDNTLKNYNYYYNKCLDLRKNRLNEVLKGDFNKVAQNRLKQQYRNEDLEKEFKDRGMQHFKIKNDTIPIKIIDKQQLMYNYNVMKAETIKGILTNISKIDSSQLEKWYEDIKVYSKTTYNHTLQKTYNSYLFLGSNNIKKEEVYLYYCLTDAKIYIIKRNTISI